MPIFGLGTWKSKPGEVSQAVKDAIDIGYRHFDCAHIYGNEKEVGDGIQAKIVEGVIKREDIFVTSKLWNTFHRPDLVVNACKATVANLGINYVDLYLIHWPMGYKEDGAVFPFDDKGKVQYSTVDYVDTWPEMEKCVELGLARSIGVSNFNSKQLLRVLEIAKIIPAMNQVECHPYLNQSKLMAFCKERDIGITAYSPLGSADRPWAKPGDPLLIEDPKIKAIADKYGKTAAQVVLKYQVQRGNVTIPKSVNKARLLENFSIFDFELSAEDMSVIDGFDCNGRLIVPANVEDHPHFPFAIEF